MKERGPSQREQLLAQPARTGEARLRAIVSVFQTLAFSEVPNRKQLTGSGWKVTVIYPSSFQT